MNSNSLNHGCNRDEAIRAAVDRWVTRLREIEVSLSQVGKWEPWGTDRLADGSADPAHEALEFRWNPLISLWSPATSHRAFQVTVHPDEPGQIFSAHVKSYEKDPDGFVPGPTWPVAMLGVLVNLAPEAEQEASELLRRWMDPNVSLDDTKTYVAALEDRRRRFWRRFRRRR